MTGAGAPYYVGVLTAAALHGAAPQAPQEFQVVTTSWQRPVVVGRERLPFLKKRTLARTPVMPVKTVTGSLRVSTPEATALDLLRYVAAAGYLSNVATVLRELAEACDAGRLVEAAQTAALPQAQRLGSLLDLVARSQLADPLARWLAERRPDWTRLDPGQPARRARRELRWHVLRLLRQASRLERAAPRRQEGRTLLARCAEESRASPRGGPALAAHRTDRATSPPRGRHVVLRSRCSRPGRLPPRARRRPQDPAAPRLRSARVVARD